MPIYEYQCEKCRHCFEVLVFRSDDETGDCPQCGHSRVKRLLSSSCFIGSSGGGSCKTASPKGFS
ncbi:MAG: zinc ribbon domain-containing protein [Deltaproteobacteria bacterium]|nr:zinc ribbon domain-containing protein [Deltaproteobacteria bacterium]